MLRFFYFDWIAKLYLEPSFNFSYYGFEWVQPLGPYTYLLFIFCGLSALMLALGWHYRLSAILLFLSFSYIELMDKTTFLNHYYFVSIVSGIMIFMPAGKAFSVDAGWSLKGVSQKIPAAYFGVLWALVSLVYFYAGLAKLNSDWLIYAQPLKLWLPGSYDLPLLGPYLDQDWLAYAFSWAGAAFDLTVPFLLWFPRTRGFALFFVVVFHLLTRLLFPIGIFPFIMVLGAFTFVKAERHTSLLQFLRSFLPRAVFKDEFKPNSIRIHPVLTKAFILLIAFQLIWPWRYLAYPGELFWHEQGFRFSWRVMLMEKAGYAQFTIKDPIKDISFKVDNAQFLSPFQEKQMSFQPDFILEYAHYLKEHYDSVQGHDAIEVYADVAVALNGRPSQPFIDSSVNLAAQMRGFKNKAWILPFNDTIYGL